jgi:serine/threonine-protein kinase ATR
MACAGARNIDGKVSESASASNFTCSLCDIPGAKFRKDCAWDDLQSSHVVASFVSLLSLQGFQKCVEARVVAMLALRRVAFHCPLQVSRLANTKYGEWCLQSLRSSVRELRIAAGRTLASFLHDGINADSRRQNRIHALEALQNLLGGNAIPILETSLLALTEIAQVCGEDELNIVLVSLVQYLGHQNPYLTSLAYNQLLKLAHSAGDTPAGLLRPFWRTVAVTVVKDLYARPQIGQQLSDLMGMHISDLLVLTESHTLPYLVLTKNVDIVRKIAFAHGSDTSTKSLLTQDDNLPAILALLLMQPSSEPEKTIMSLLKEFSPDFENPLYKLVDKTTIRTACEILKTAGDAQEGKGSKVCP